MTALASLFLHALDIAVIPCAVWVVWKLFRDPWGTR